MPRTEVDFLPGDMPAHRAVREVLQAPHSRYPVMGESADDIIGFVHVRDLLDPDVSGADHAGLASWPGRWSALPDTVRVLRALNDMRRERQHLAIVLDEYGGTAGIVTMEDLVEELVGDITDEYDVVVEDTVGLPRRVRGGRTDHLDEFAEKTGLRAARRGRTTPSPASSWPSSASCRPSATPVGRVSLSTTRRPTGRVDLAAGHRARRPPGRRLRRPPPRWRRLQPGQGLTAPRSGPRLEVSQEDFHVYVKVCR